MEHKMAHNQLVERQALLVHNILVVHMKVDKLALVVVVVA